MLIAGVQKSSYALHTHYCMQPELILDRSDVLAVLLGICFCLAFLLIDGLLSLAHF